MKVTAIKCNDCNVIFQKTKNKISFQGDVCPFCGTTGELHTIKVNKNELTTNE